MNRVYGDGDGDCDCDSDDDGGQNVHCLYTHCIDSAHTPHTMPYTNAIHVPLNSFK